MPKTIKIVTECPACKTPVSLTAEVDPIQTAPKIRGEIPPVGSIFVYKISSEQIKQFIINKARAAEDAKDVKIEVVPVYTEKRRHRDGEPHKSYASLRIAFSEEGLEQKTEDQGWFGRIGNTSTNMTIVKSLFDDIVTKYKYNRKEVEKWLNSYKTLEKLEENLGITEKFVNDLLLYCTPQRIVANNKENWVIFAAAAENVIADMLTDPKTHVPVGRIQIQDVYQISKDVVEFIVYLHPADMKLKEDPHVRKILMGEEKARKV